MKDSVTITRARDALNASVKSLARNIELGTKALEMCLRLDLEDTYPDGSWGSITFTTENRSDVEKLLTLAPEGKYWKKEPSGKAITYELYDPALECMIRIYAKSGALPPTCEIVEEEVVVPAQASYTYKREVLKCKTPAGDSPSESPVPAQDNTSEEEVKL